MILLIWARILLVEAKSAVLNARLEDSTRLAIFVFVLIAAVASLVSVAVLIGGAKGRIALNGQLTAVLRLIPE